MTPLHGAAALMDWLGKHMPQAQQMARSFAGPTDFHVYMRDLTGVALRRIDSHDDACESYLDALMVMQDMGAVPSKDFAEALAEALAQKPAAPEPQRPPLDWNKPTPFDPFKDFTTTSGGETTAFYVGGPFGQFRSPDMAR